MIRILNHIPDGGAQGWYRAVAPVKHCQDELLQEGIELTASPSVSGEYNAIILHRIISPGFKRPLMDMQKTGTKIVWSIDDDLWNLPEWNPGKKVFDMSNGDINWMRDYSDAICVSTWELADAVVNSAALQGHTDDHLDALEAKISVCPNLIDVTQWPEPRQSSNDPLRILWAGSGCHSKDIDLLVEPLERILKEFDVRMYFFGDIPTAMTDFIRFNGCLLGMAVPHARYGGKVGLIKPVPLEEYIPYLVDIQPDIALCPLVDQVFNRSKSNIKFLEMTMAGAACVCSNCPAYPTGECVEPDEWYKEIKSLIEFHGKRWCYQRHHRQTVLERYSWQCQAKETWLRFFRDLTK